MTNSIIDLSHWNTVTSWEKVRNAGIEAVIHKATEGRTLVDRRYKERKPLWKKMGKWGAYHFAGASGDGVEQAKHFLGMVEPEKDDLLVLDYEKSKNGIMSIRNAERFVEEVFKVMGRYPVLYSGNDIGEQLGNRKDTVLKECPLWMARYSREPVIPPAWDKWTMWQYTDGKDTSVYKGQTLPKTVDGIGPCDRNLFNGTKEELDKFWGKTEKYDISLIQKELSDLGITATKEQIERVKLHFINKKILL